jgi:hypothetical protein
VIANRVCWVYRVLGDTATACRYTRFAAGQYPGLMMDDRDQEVAGLPAEGYSYRAIAKVRGMSLAGVQRALQRTQKLDDHDDALDPLPLDDDSPPVGSVRIVGVDEFDERVELFTDERGRRFNLLDLYRHGRIDGGALFREALRRLEAAGCR